MAFVPWFLIMDLREKFFLQSVNPWLNWQGDNDQDFTSKYTDLFSILQLLALPCATFSGSVISIGTKYYSKHHNMDINTLDPIGLKKTKTDILTILTFLLAVY